MYCLRGRYTQGSPPSARPHVSRRLCRPARTARPLRASCLRAPASPATASADRSFGRLQHGPARIALRPELLAAAGRAPGLPQRSTRSAACRQLVPLKTRSTPNLHVALEALTAGEAPSAHTGEEGSPQTVRPRAALPDPCAQAAAPEWTASALPFAHTGSRFGGGVAPCGRAPAAAGLRGHDAIQLCGRASPGLAQELGLVRRGQSFTPGGAGANALPAARVRSDASAAEHTACRRSCDATRLPPLGGGRGSTSLDEPRTSVQPLPASSHTHTHTHTAT
jgi:hypothetical protein